MWVTLILMFALLGVMIWWMVGVFKPTGKISDTGSMICRSCGTRGEPKQITKGSGGMELVLWLCFIIPGLIYSVWRLSSRYPGCPDCGQSGMIKVNTPNGKLLIERAKRSIGEMVVPSPVATGSCGGGGDGGWLGKSPVGRGTVAAPAAVRNL